jgi:hypothetical protein
VVLQGVDNALVERNVMVDAQGLQSAPVEGDVPRPLGGSVGRRSSRVSFDVVSVKAQGFGHATRHVELGQGFLAAPLIHAANVVAELDIKIKNSPLLQLTKGSRHIKDGSD